MTRTTLAFPTPAALGSIDQYIQAVNRFPLLSAEQEVEFGRRLRDHDDLDAARQLVLSHLRLVVAVSRNYLGYGLPQSDLIQEGNVGLMKAVRRFDPERGVRLVSFALHWIKAEIHEYVLRNWRLVKVATTKAQRKLFFNLRSNKTGLDAMSPTQIDALAKLLDVKREEVIEMETRLSGRDIGFDAPADQDEDHGPVVQGPGQELRIAVADAVDFRHAGRGWREAAGPGCGRRPRPPTKRPTSTRAQASPRLRASPSTRWFRRCAHPPSPDARTSCPSASPSGRRHAHRATRSCAVSR